MTNKLKNLLEGLRAHLAQKLASAKNPAVLWSGGIDSGLVLFLAREINPQIPVIQFRADLRPGQLEFSNGLIRDWDLRVIYFYPKNRYFVPNGTGVSLVDEYSIGDDLIPVIRDAVHSDDYCSLQISPRRTPFFNYQFDLSLVGWRESDKHSVFDFKLPESVDIGGSEFHAPLFSLSDEEVFLLTTALGIPRSEFYRTKDETLDTGNLAACTNCINTTGKVYCPKAGGEIDGVDWARNEVSAAFSARFTE